MCFGIGPVVQRAGGSGRMSPVRARTMKEYEQVWSTVWPHISINTVKLETEAVMPTCTPTPAVHLISA